MSIRSALTAACMLLACCGCGFKGPLYLPERNARVVTHPAPAAQGAPASPQGPAASSRDKRKAHPPHASPPAATAPPTPGP